MICFNDELIVPYHDGLHEGVIFPLVKCYQKNGRVMCFLAAQHSMSPDSETHQMIDRITEDFKPDAVIIEGLQTSKDPAWDRQVEEYYLQQAKGCIVQDPVHISENFYALYKLKNLGAHTLSGEPSEHAQMKNLICAGYDEKDYLFFNFLLSIDQWKMRQLPDNDVFKIWERHLERARSYTACEIVDYEDFVEWFEKHTRISFSLDRMDGVFLAPEATALFGSINHIASILSQYRDKTLLNIIQSALNNFEKVFVVYGGSHFFTLKNAFENEMKEVLR